MNVHQVRRHQPRQRVMPKYLSDQLLVVGLTLLPIQIESGQSFRLAPTDAIIAGAVLLRFAERRLRFPTRILGGVAMALLAGVTWAALVGEFRGSIERSAVIDRGLGALALVALAVTIATTDYARVKKGIQWAGWLAISLHASVSVGMPLLTQKVPGRNSGGLVDPNNAGVLLAALLAFEVADLLVRYRGDWPSKLHAAKVIALFYFLSDTGSRTGWASAAVGAVLAPMLLKYLLDESARARLSSLRQKAKPMLVIALPLLMAVSLTRIVDQIARLSTRPDNVAKREAVFGASFGSFLDSFGIGGGLFHTVHERIGFPHNSFVWLVGDAGLVGFACFAAVVLWPPMALIRMIRDSGAIDAGPTLCALVAMLPASFGIEALYQRQWWVFIGLTASWVSIAQARDRAVV